jgi:DNA repair photolyase
MPCNLNRLNFQIDPYIGCEHYCYYCYALKYAETNWLEEIMVYEDIKEQLQNEISNISPQTIYLGNHTDPYQPLESDLYQTRQILEILLEKGFSASILTKSNLVTRDIDILKEMPESNVSISVAFEDDEIRKCFESNTMNTGDRIDALRLCKENGISTSSLICPVIPHITKTEKLVYRLAPYADKIWIYGLSLQEKNEEASLNVERILKHRFPQNAKEIESIIADKNHGFWTKLRNKLQEIQHAQKLNLSINI